jgi:hypothetical protein
MPHNGRSVAFPHSAHVSCATAVAAEMSAALSVTLWMFPQASHFTGAVVMSRACHGRCASASVRLWKRGSASLEL